MKKKTKILSLIIALMLSVGLIPSTVFQAAATEVKEISDVFVWGVLHEYKIGDEFNLNEHITQYVDEVEISYNDGTYKTFYFDGNTLTNYTESYVYTVIDCPEILEESYYEVILNIDDGSTNGYNFTIDIIVEPDYNEPGTPSINVSSIEITNAPYNPTYIKGTYDSLPLYYGLEMLITLEDGTTYNYSYEEDGQYPAIGEDAIYINEVIEDLEIGTNFITYNYCGCTASQEISVIEDPYVTNPVVNIEIIKAPNKTFSEALFHGSLTDEIMSSPDLKEENSVARNMKGAELSITRADGTTLVYIFDIPRSNGWNTWNGIYWIDEYNSIYVQDAGDFKAEVEFKGCTTSFTANHAPLPHPTDPVPTPEYTTVLTDSETNITIKGNFDSETSLNVEKTTVQLDGAKIAYDITLTKNGVEIQPDSEITVSIPHSENGCKVFWVKADGTTEDMNATYTDGYYVFTTTHLSTYAVVATTDSPSNSETKPSTVDTATTDTANKGTNDNGTVQTGNPVTAFAVLMLVTLASGIVFIYFNRKSKI